MQPEITADRAAKLKADAITACRASRPAWRNEHYDRQAREREARRVAGEHRKAQQEAEGTKRCTKCHQTLPLDSFALRKSGRQKGTRKARCKPCLSAEGSAYYRSNIQTHEVRQRKVARSAVRRRKAAERVARLSAILGGTDPSERINSEDEWDATASELKKLWQQSGDKQCVSCKVVVPPAAMLPPGPGNFYPGTCQPCVHKERTEDHIRRFGSPPPGPRPIPLWDGTTVTIGELARRHRDREQTRRDRGWFTRGHLWAA